jgi:hypothetical protein
MRGGVAVMPEGGDFEAVDPIAIEDGDAMEAE